jgi:hypothetical protein
MAVELGEDQPFEETALGILGIVGQIGVDLGERAGMLALAEQLARLL